MTSEDATALRALCQRQTAALAEVRAERDRYREVLSAPLWLVWANEHKAWRGPNEKGYYTDTKAAGRYSFEDAMNIMIASGEKGDCTDYILPSPEWIGQRTAALTPPAEGDGGRSDATV